MKFMMHGPCGLDNHKSPYIIKGQCSKYFPKKIQNETMIDENGFAIYRRRNDGRYAMKNEIKLDNRFVVPYNLDLVIR